MLHDLRLRLNTFRETTPGQAVMKPRQRRPHKACGASRRADRTHSICESRQGRQIQRTVRRLQGFPFHRSRPVVLRLAPQALCDRRDRGLKQFGSEGRSSDPLPSPGQTERAPRAEFRLGGISPCSNHLVAADAAAA